MGLKMREKQAIIRELAERFRASSKKERGRILDQCVELTGYSRCYAAFALRCCGKKQVRMIGDKRIIFIPGHARPPGTTRKRPGRYNSSVILDALIRLWALSDGLCGKRLVAFIRDTLPLLERQGSISLPDDLMRQRLMSISPATVDRLLVKTKALTQLKGRSTTRPGTLLKYHIPVRTFADWNEQQPGFCEVDLVAHDGGCAFGDYIQTLDVTDVATGWTEARAVKNKAQCHVFEALKYIRYHLPFPMLGIDSDNGGEFINNELNRYCLAEKITFTRSRPYRKNDNCFVEQKNYSIVRRTVGYYRYETLEQLDVLNKLYALLAIFSNFFQPVMKLKEKVRNGSRLTRRYDTPLTPYRRITDHPSVADDVKRALHEHYHQLDLVQLKRSINLLQAQLFRTAVTVTQNQQRIPPSYPKLNHPWRKSGIRLRRDTLNLQTPVISGATQINTQKRSFS